MCSRRRRTTEHEEHDWMEESVGAKRVVGPFHVVKAESSESDGTAMASS